MRFPSIRGTIDRRILVNYRVDPEVLARVLPAPFRPKLHADHGVAGICLIRLKDVRPAMAPECLGGLSSENAAHRVAVEWDGPDGAPREGVYIPRRDTDSRLNALVGGRLFPGVHHHATFDVAEDGRRFCVAMKADDGSAQLEVDSALAPALQEGSIFDSLEDSSTFFERGSLGYSDTGREGVYDGLELKTQAWRVEPLEVARVASSWFGDRDRFPAGSVSYDHALLMRDIPHEWLGRDSLCC